MPAGTDGTTNNTKLIILGIRNIRFEKLRCSIAGDYFAIAGWQPDEERYHGTITDWVKKRDELIRIKFEGDRTATQHELANLLDPKFGFKLEPYEDCRPAPVQPLAPARGEQRTAARVARDAMDALSVDSGSGGSQASEHQDAEEAGEEEDDDSSENEDAHSDVTQTDQIDPNLLECHGQAWTQLPAEGVRSDNRRDARQPPKLLANGAIRSSYDLAMALIPPQWVQLILRYTNASIREDFGESTFSIHAPLTKGEAYALFGMMLALCVETGKSVLDMWSTKAADYDLLPPPAFGRHGMTKNRFLFLKQRLRWYPSAEHRPAGADTWWFVTELTELFNDRMAHTLSPGWLLVVDESMCAWRGRYGTPDNPHVLPVLSWVPRKPEPMGMELKTTADAITSAIIFVEPCMGKDTHPNLEYFEEWGHTTATTLRITKPWQGTNRVVGGDSWFSSVKTAQALRGVGLHYVGDVKTAHRRFPKKALQQAVGEERGDWSTMTSTIDVNGSEETIFAVGHRRHGKVHSYVFTAGVTLKGKVHPPRLFLSCVCGTHLCNDACAQPYCWTVDDEDGLGSVMVERKTPRVLNDYTLAQPGVDRHNRYRQRLLAMEKRMVTNSFAFRYFTTLLGMVFTNAFFLRRFFNDRSAEFKDVMREISVGL